jgi:signal transduction histidine kinase/CheY-like chemotaxis protein
MRERRRREEVERHLQQAQKMEALGLLAGSVAHDFNNLLGAIQGFAGFIAEDSAEDEPASYYAQRILTASKRGKTLIGQILSFSRQLEMKREVFVPADLIAETTALLTASVPATSTVSVETDPETPALVGDRDLLGQALFNLCTNANDALGGQPGTISIKTHPTDLTRPELGKVPEGAGSVTNVWEDGDGGIHAATGSFDPARQCVSLVVSDTGCGMDRGVVEKIFVPFFSTKQHDHGTGLGLAAVHRTVVAHQGAVLVHSRPGGGSTFELILPCDDRLVPPQPKDQPARTAATAVGGRILLVDDNQDFGDMLLAALERRGFDVSPCSDPRDALEGIKEFPDAWHVMITDQTMPHMSGLELIRSAKAVQPELVCFLCTGYAEDALDDATLAEAGAIALLRKPVDIDDLVERLTPYLPH